MCGLLRGVLARDFSAEDEVFSRKMGSIGRECGDLESMILNKLVENGAVE